MALLNENEVQINPDGTGKQIRNLLVTTLINGVPTQVYMQVLAISDSDGNLIDFSRMEAFQRETIRELKAIKTILMTAFGVLVDSSSIDL